MRADNSQYLVAAARRCSNDTRDKAERALRRLDGMGRLISIESVARHAGVSRSWLHGQLDLRAEIDTLRGSARNVPAEIPKRQRASDASLRSRLDAANARTRALAAENQMLREQLAAALAELRSLRSSRR